MGSRFQSRGWQRFRTGFRWCRISVWFFILLVVASGAYLNQIGLPDFLKQRLVARLHAQGVDLNFSRLRLRYYRGIVADNVHFGAAGGAAAGPGFSAGEVELKLDHAALRHFQIVIDSLIVHEGKFVWPLTDTNRPPPGLSVNDIETRVRFLPGGQLELDHFTAGFAGARMRFTGSFTNASAIADWKIFQPAAQARPGPSQQQLTDLADLIESIKFADVPQLRVAISGDGRDPRTFNGTLDVSTREAETPWGNLKNGTLALTFPPLDAAHPQPHGTAVLHAEAASSRWGSTRDFNLRLDAREDPAQTNLIHAKLDLGAGQFSTQWVQATNAHFAMEWSHALPDPVPASGRAELSLGDLHTRWGTADTLRLDASLRTPGTNAAATPARPDWGWWAKLAPYWLDWDCRLGGLQAENQGTVFHVQQVAFGGGWRAPDLTVTNLHTELYRGALNLKAGLDVATRVLTFDGSSDFDIEKLSPLMSEKSRDSLQQFSLEQPPRLRGRGEITLPAWTNSQPDWQNAVLPTLKLDANVEAGRAAYRTVSILSTRARITYSNLSWCLSDVVVARPEGEVRLMHVTDDRTGRYYFRIHSTVDIMALAPLLDPDQRGVFDLVTMTGPPAVDAEIWGRWHVPESIGVRAELNVTNFTVRREPEDRLHTTVAYTNKFLRFDHPRVERGAGFATADSVDVDIVGRRLFLTNGFSTIEPAAIIHPIGPMVTHNLEPYQFLKPPTAHANGIIPLTGDVPADVYFDLDGGPFRWSKFNLAHGSGRLHWVGEWLTLSNMQADFYGGHVAGSAAFHTGARPGTPFSFDARVTQANLNSLIADLADPTNHLEGAFNCHVLVTNADTIDWKSWFGRGDVDLRDGLVWEIPIFGIMSKPLNAVMPGLGTSRATEGTASFTITNSIIRTSDLELRARLMRLLYRGTVDFDGRTEAVVQGQLGRDIPYFGRLVSMVFMPLAKVFEYKITGSLGQPKLTPLWAPVKALYLPSYLYQGLKDLMPGTPANTNAPPSFDTNAPPPTVPQP